MGCDIHVFMEQKRSINREDKWVNVDYWQVNPYCGDEYEPKMSIKKFYHGRSYWLFSTLANVRNRDNWPYIDDPRGLPNDVSPEVKAESDRWDCDGHSHSYFTLAELMDYAKKTQFVKVTGMISPEQKKDLDNGIQPKTWCGWTSNESYVNAEWTVENKSLEPFIEAFVARIKELEWYYGEERFNEWLEENKDKYRTVFWFDN